MYIHARTRSGLELMKWLALLVVAGAIVLLLLGAALAAKANRPPGLLPHDVSAEPMPIPYRSSDYLDMKIQDDRFGLTADIWRALEFQQRGEIDAAIEIWQAVRLPAGTDHWRLLMLGIAYLQADRMEDATHALDRSKEMMPDNPVVYYAIGLVELQKANSADEWYDATSLDSFRMVSQHGTNRAPLTRSLYRLRATMAFERAIELARYVDMDQTLLPEAWVLPDEHVPSMALMVPRVRDALEAFEGDRFESRAHLALGLLYMDRGSFTETETHLDKAAELGEATGKAFRELALRLEQDEMANDAMRVYLKAFAHGGGATCVGDAWRAIERGLINN